MQFPPRHHHYPPSSPSIPPAAPRRRPTIYLSNEDDTHGGQQSSSASNFVQVSLDQDHAYIPFGDIADEFQISSVLECDENGSVLPRSLLISQPSAALKDGGFYIARRTNEQRWGNGGGGGLPNPASRGTMPYLDTIGEKRPRSEDNTVAGINFPSQQPNIGSAPTDNAAQQQQGGIKARKGVAFSSTVAVTEFTIGGNSSDSFRSSLNGYSTSAGRPPSLSSHPQSSREPLRSLSSAHHHHEDWFTSMQIIPFQPYASGDTTNSELITEDTVMQWLRNSKDRETLVPLQMQEAERILGEVDAFLLEQRAQGFAE